MWLQPSGRNRELQHQFLAALDALSWMCKKTSGRLTVASANYYSSKYPIDISRVSLAVSNGALFTTRCAPGASGIFFRCSSQRSSPKSLLRPVAFAFHNGEASTVNLACVHRKRPSLSGSTAFDLLRGELSFNHPGTTGLYASVSNKDKSHWDVDGNRNQISHG